MAPDLATNVNNTIGEATKDALILCQFKHQVVFHPYIQEFTPPALTNRSGWPALPDHVGTSQTSHVLTKTAAPNIATQATIGSGKINSNRAQTTDGKSATPILPSGPDGDITLVASSGESDGDSEYVKLPKFFYELGQHNGNRGLHPRT